MLVVDQVSTASRIEALGQTVIVFKWDFEFVSRRPHSLLMRIRVKEVLQQYLLTMFCKTFLARAESIQ